MDGSIYQRGYRVVSIAIDLKGTDSSGFKFQFLAVDNEYRPRPTF